MNSEINRARNIRFRYFTMFSKQFLPIWNVSRIAILSTLKLYVHFLLFSKFFALLLCRDHFTEWNEQGSITDSYGKWLLFNCEQVITLVSLISAECLCLFFFNQLFMHSIYIVGPYQTCTDTLTWVPWILVVASLIDTLSCEMQFILKGSK